MSAVTDLCPHGCLPRLGLALFVEGPDAWGLVIVNIRDDPRLPAFALRGLPSAFSHRHDHSPVLISAWRARMAATRHLLLQKRAWDRRPVIGPVRKRVSH